MAIKESEKTKAIELRKKGFSYVEILKSVPVAKSTLSLWLRSVGLSKKQKQKLTEKKLASMERGWLKWKQKRVDFVEKTKAQARADVKNISARELWLIGVALYWAEGAKEKEKSVSQQVNFNNSDPLMANLFLRWLREVAKVNEEDLVYEIYIHENSKNNLDKVKKYWAEKLKIGINKLDRVYFKRNKIKTNRKNISDNYFGLVRIRVRKSSTLNRRISGWVEGITNYCGIV